MPDKAQVSASNPPMLKAFVDILDILVNDFDIIEVLTRLTSDCVEVLHIDAAGILLADTRKVLRIVGASSEQIQLLELFQLQNEQGPCLDCFTTGKAVSAPDLTAPTPWPDFAALCVAAGYRSVYAIPLHHNSVTLGCLNLFMSSAEPLAPGNLAVAQALADVASIAIVQSHGNERTGDRDGPLNHALNSRVTIEQAKGMIAEHFSVDVHDAFEMLRSHARASGQSLIGTAIQLVAGTTTIDAFQRQPAVHPDMSELMVDISIERNRRIVRIGGELDLATKAACFNACVDGEGDTVEVDISNVTFMDCCGYSALIAARHVLEQRGGSLSVTHPSNQPAQLLALLFAFDTASPSTLHHTHALPDTTRPSPHEAPAPVNAAVARSFRQSITQILRMWSSRHTDVTPSSPEKTERTTIMQIQPTQADHLKPSTDGRADGEPPDRGS